MSVSTSRQPRGAAVMAAIAHVMALACGVMVLVWCTYFRGGLSFSSSDKSLVFNLHPVFMIGFIITGGEATIVHRFLAPKRKLVHAILHTLALVFASLGICSALNYHIKSGITNFFTLHSWLGILLFFLYAIQGSYKDLSTHLVSFQGNDGNLTYGFIMFLCPHGSAKERGEFIDWHVKIGVSIFVLAIGTAILGFVEKLTWLESIGGVGEFSSEAVFVNFTALSVLLFGIFIVAIAISKRPPPSFLEVDQFTNVGYLLEYGPLISQC